MSVQGTFPQLIAEQFDNWMFRLQCLLEERGLNDIITKEKVEEKEKTLDAKAKSIIVQCLTDKHLNLIKECTSSYSMLTVLKDTFQRKSIISKISLRRKLLNLKHNKRNLEEYFSVFDNVIRELEVSGEKIDECDKICYLLTGLGEEYNHIITAIETLNSEIKLDFVKAKLLDHEVRRTCEQDPQTSFVVTCFKCKKKGHKSFECYSRGKGRGHGYRGPRSRGGVAHPAQEHNLPLFIATNQALQSQNEPKGIITFVVDSGATKHFIQEQYEKYVKNVTELPDKLQIKIANGENLIAIKKGYLDVYYQHEKLRIEVVIVPGLSNNLMSVSQLVERKKQVIFKKEQLLIISDTKKVYHGDKKGMLYTFTLKLEQRDSCNISEEDKDVNIWHRRLGHMCRKNLAILGLPYSNEKCEVCLRTKATRLPFKRVQRPRSTNIGDLIHTDISGPTRVSTNEGYKYFQTIIDDASHFTQTYLLKNKNEATDKLIQYIKEMERQDEHKVKRIRCDNEGSLQQRD